MPDPSYGRNGRAVMKRDLAEIAAAHVASSERIRAFKREQFRMDAPAVDPALLEGAQAVFVRGSGWRIVVKLNVKTVKVLDRHSWDGVSLVPIEKVVDVK